eukprot:137266_1
MALDLAGYTPGIWLWEDQDRGVYAKFDGPTSQEIEDGLKNAIQKSTIGPVEVGLSQGPFFGQDRNKGIYTVVLMVDCKNPEKPVVSSARQTNVKTGFARKVKRDPGLDPPLDPQLQSIVDNLQAKWEWKDDYAWKLYDIQTIAQVEEAFKKKVTQVTLTEGSYFSRQQGTYYITFNHLSFPGSAQQHNANSKYSRWCRRVPVQAAGSKSAKKEKQQEAFMKKDKHWLWRKFYAPLSKEDFEDQWNDDKLKANLKCSICLNDFEATDLLENQKKGAKAAAKKIQITKSDDDAKDNNGDAKRKHRFDLCKARNYVNDATIIRLKDCAYGHYFHAECILQSLVSRKTCPNCTMPYGVIIGHQPDGRLYMTKGKTPCEGFPDADASVKMVFEFPGGQQNEHHPNPGKIYFGDLREAWLPNNRDGREAAMLVRLAFKRKLIFQIGTSLTLGQDNRIVFGSIHLKTATKGGPEKHGFPDEKYFDRLKTELKVKGISTALLTEEDHTFINGGFPDHMNEAK